MRKIKDIGKYAGITIGIGILLLSAFAFAKDSGKSLTLTANKKLETVGQRRIQALQNLATSTIKQRLEDIQKKADEAKQNLEKIRDEAQAKMKQAKEKLEEKMNEIRDKQKQKMAQQIEKQFDHLNQVWTDHFTKVLNRFDAILEKIKTRADKAAANGQDVSGVDTLIKTAETTISNARTAVEAQAKKTYTVDLTVVNSGVATTTTPTGQDQLIKNLRAQFKTLRDQLMKDLFGLRDGVMKDSRNAVQDALQALSKVPKVDEEPVATSTPSS